MTQPMFVIERKFAAIKKKVEKQLKQRDALNAIVETALINACNFAWSRNNLSTKNFKIVFSIVSVDNMHGVCWATKATYLSAKTLCDSMNDANEYNNHNMKAVVAQYVGADVYVSA